MSKGLGKGFEALLATKDLLTPTFQKDSIQQIPVNNIFANPHQPRKEFEPQALHELAISIKEKGILQPILVEVFGEGYQIIAGERRFRAATIAGLKEVPAIVRTSTDEERLEIALIENLQRADLTPLEEAKAYRHMMDSFHYTQEIVAQKVGKQRSTVANALRLLKLPPFMQDSLEKGEITAGHARAILSSDKEAIQLELYQTILKDGLNVREAEQFVIRRSAEQNKHQQGSKNWKIPSSGLYELEQSLIGHFGTKVRITGNNKKGTIVISYFSEDDLNRVIEILNAPL